MPLQERSLRMSLAVHKGICGSGPGLVMCRHPIIHNNVYHTFNPVAFGRLWPHSGLNTAPSTRLGWEVEGLTGPFVSKSASTNACQTMLLSVATPKPLGEESPTDVAAFDRSDALSPQADACFQPGSNVQRAKRLIRDFRLEHQRYV